MRIAAAMLALLLAGAAAAQQDPGLLDVTVVLDGQPFEGRLVPGASLVLHSEPVPIEEVPEGVGRIPKRSRCFPARQLVVTLERIVGEQALFQMQVRNDAGEFRCEATDTLGEVWSRPALTMMLGTTGSIRQSTENNDLYDLLEVSITPTPPVPEPGDGG